MKRYDAGIFIRMEKEMKDELVYLSYKHGLIYSEQLRKLISNYIKTLRNKWYLWNYIVL